MANSVSRSSASHNSRAPFLRHAGMHAASTKRATDVIAAFLLALSALFSIINPIGGAFMFRDATAPLTHGARLRLFRHCRLQPYAGDPRY